MNFNHCHFNRRGKSKKNKLMLGKAKLLHLPFHLGLIKQHTTK